MRFPKGSEWRKWDLHVHVPGTKLNNRYVDMSGRPDFDRFADLLERSDVAVIAITDYFSATGTLEFIEHFKLRYPNSEKLLLVNVELRLNEAVNGASESVDFHVIFRDTVHESKIREFFSRLKTQITDAQGRQKSCVELSTNRDYMSASVTRPDIQAAFQGTFGVKAEPIDYLIYLAPSNNNGLRAPTGSQRRANLADEIDKLVHAIYGKNESNTKYYLRTDRFEDAHQVSNPKPVFGGCDAHSFEEVEEWLGKAVDDTATHQVITWIKADPSFDGLQQTLFEPSDRVSLSVLKPDVKDPYRVISKVRFERSNDFPSEIVLNPNLNAIIGSRSSGKSALLAHIAHAVDPEYTVAQQSLANLPKNEDELGPAAGKSWKTVEGTICRVEWADGTIDGGTVIYIPQNWLYRISDNPKEVTDKIRPVLEAHYELCFREHKHILGAVKRANDSINKAVTEWFELTIEHSRLTAEIRTIGEKASITKTYTDLSVELETLRNEHALGANELEMYQSVVNQITDNKAHLDEINIEIEQLNRYVLEDEVGKFAVLPNAFEIQTNLLPDLKVLPDSLAISLKTIIETSNAKLIGSIESSIVEYRTDLANKQHSFKQLIENLGQDNSDLIDRYKANAALDGLMKRQKVQQVSLDRIEKIETQQASIVDDRQTVENQLIGSLAECKTSLESLKDNFDLEPRKLDRVTFGIAVGVDSDEMKQLSAPFRKNERGTFLTKGADSDPLVDVERAKEDPHGFMEALFNKKQKLNQNHQPLDVAKLILTATPEVRFTAELDGDLIGGFEPSTMTPGKQALFALSLILGETADLCPLLIDQPEDDLDSRSVYVDIVRYLIVQKRQRQIILVTHNANLVIGADAEEVIVANRHGDDRKNRDGRTFDYLSGALEHSMTRRTAINDLDRMGIREHACEILDGGEEAFQKRKVKYKI